MPQRDIYFSSKDPVTGRIVFKGNKIKHAEGNPYLVDCNVMGSNVGTAYSPNFPLISSIKVMIAPNGPYVGVTVVFQEDSAGLHTEQEYSKWMQTTFQELGWKVELQAPQGTFNNLYETLYYAHVYFLLYFCTFNNLYETLYYAHVYCLLYFCCTGPYTNVLDLYLFPSMSHRHSAMLQICNNTVNKE